MKNIHFSNIENCKKEMKILIELLQVLKKEHKEQSVVFRILTYPAFFLRCKVHKINFNDWYDIAIQNVNIIMHSNDATNALQKANQQVAHLNQLKNRFQKL